MFGTKQRRTVIAKGCKIRASVTADVLVEVNSQIDGELHCTSLVIAPGANVSGTVAAERVVVNGTVEGPIQGGQVHLKSQAHVVGDIHHQSLAIERDAYFDGRSVQVRGHGQTPKRLERKSARQIAKTQESLSPQIEPGSMTMELHMNKAACGACRNAKDRKLDRRLAELEPPPTSLVTAPFLPLAPTP